MNNNIKAFAMFAAVALTAASCSKWTEQEPVGFKYLTLEEKNPALYESYLQGVREYRETEHQVLIARFDNKGAKPVSVADHITALPDSVDYIVLNNPEAIGDALMEEIDAVREKKAQKVLAAVNFNAIAKEYKLYLDELAEVEVPEGQEAPEPKAQSEFVGEKVAEFLAIVDEKKLDGILASYEGVNPASLQEEKVEELKALQESFFAPICRNVGTDKVLFYEGTAKYVLAENVLDLAKYIIVPAESETNSNSLNYNVYKILAAGVPTDRIVIGVTAFDVTDETATNGVFSGKSSAIAGAAEWAVLPAAGFKKAGVCVNHAQFDYFHFGNEYSEICAAIATMNPSPLK